MPTRLSRVYAPASGPRTVKLPMSHRVGGAKARAPCIVPRGLWMK
jgi:hypothetical protein